MGDAKTKKLPTWKTYIPDVEEIRRGLRAMTDQEALKEYNSYRQFVENIRRWHQPQLSFLVHLEERRLECIRRRPH